jgi:hypothetical protein
MNNLGLDNWTLFGNDNKTASTPELIGDIIVDTAKTTFDPLRSPHLNHLKHAILSDNQPEFEKYKGNANSYNEDETLHTTPIDIALRFGRCKWVSALLDNTDRLTKERLREIFLNAFYLSMTKPEYVLKEYFEKGKYRATEEERIKRARRDVINLFQGKQQEGDMLYSKTFKDLVPDSEIDNFIAKVKTGFNHSNLSCVKVILDRFKSLNPKPEEWKKLLAPFDGVKSGTFIDEMSYALRRAYDKQNIELCKYLCNEIYKDYPQIGEVIIPTNPKTKIQNQLPTSRPKPTLPSLRVPTQIRLIKNNPHIHRDQPRCTNLQQLVILFHLVCPRQTIKRANKGTTISTVNNSHRIRQTQLRLG